MARSKRQPKSTRWVERETAVPTEYLPSEKVVKRSAAPLEAKTENQRRYISAIHNFKLVFGVGPAGTGKTFLAGSIAAAKLELKLIERVIITRPAVEAGEEFGFIPGDLNEKYEPYLAPLRAVFEDRLGKSYFEYLVKVGKIVATPLAFMRGLTFSNSFIILDEAQNTTTKQMKMFLTRLGDNCTAVIDGDPEQCDLNGPSGLTDAIARVGYIPAVKVINFTDSDIVRSGLVAEIIKAYRNPIIV